MKRTLQTKQEWPNLLSTYRQSKNVSTSVRYQSSYLGHIFTFILDTVPFQDPLLPPAHPVWQHSEQQGFLSLLHLHGKAQESVHTLVFTLELILYFVLTILGHSCNPVLDKLYIQQIQNNKEYHYYIEIQSQPDI